MDINLFNTNLSDEI
jgi:hypothetical protein